MPTDSRTRPSGTLDSSVGQRRRYLFSPTSPVLPQPISCLNHDPSNKIEYASFALYRVSFVEYYLREHGPRNLIHVAAD